MVRVSPLLWLGRNLFGKFDGVAPGAKIVDYDLSEGSFINQEKVYTIGKFLSGISTLASQARMLSICHILFIFTLLAHKKR